MDYAVEPDVPFLADALEGLAKLNVRHFRNNISLAHTVLRRMLEREYKWVDEYPDKWHDVVQMADPDRVEFDCEDFAAALAALIVICFGNAKVGIRRVAQYQCHALAGQGDEVFDVCPLFEMPGISRGPGEWREIREKPMIAEGIALITSGVRRLMTDSKETPLETGASAENIVRSLLPAASIDKLEQLEAQVKSLTKERDSLKKQIGALQKELAASKKGLAEMTSARDAQTTQRKAAEAATAKTKEQLNAESRKLVEVTAFRTACQQQLQQLLARSKDDNVRSLAREGLDRLERERPEDYMDAFGDEMQRNQAWEMLAVGAAHIATLADCDACERGEPCTNTGGADEPNGDEPPYATSGPDSDNEFDLSGPPSSERQISFSGCDGSCPR